MSFNNIIPFELIEGGIWKTKSVDEVPEVELADWIVIEVPSTIEGMPSDHHFVGYNLTEHEGRTSSKLIAWNRETRIGTTRSGRTYKLVGESGPDGDALYVLSRWLKINAITDYKDVSELYVENAPISPAELF